MFLVETQVEVAVCLPQDTGTGPSLFGTIWEDRPTGTAVISGASTDAQLL